MNTVNLTPLKNKRENEELQQYELGQIVEVPDGVGIIAAFVEEDFEFPVGQADKIERIEEEEEISDEEMETIEASPENPIYIVSLLEGGSVAVSADEIERLEGLEGEGEDVESPDEVIESGGAAETAPVYKYCDDPSNVAELEEAKVKYIHENYAEELADIVIRVLDHAEECGIDLWDFIEWKMQKNRERDEKHGKNY